MRNRAGRIAIHRRRAAGGRTPKVRRAGALALWTALLLGFAAPAFAIDTDGDGLEDDFETTHGFDPADPDENGNALVTV